MQIAGAWLSAPSTQRVLALLIDAGHAAYCVGGCVRNAIMGEPVADVDIATDAEPDRVMKLAQAAGLQAVPTGIEHGTVTVVCDGTGYEVTTFRADIETDGRHANVVFTNQIAEDARRRDFTMNALYSDASGLVVDPINGLPDALARRVVFIEDARQRIHEDYLRILRFFRFHAWYADPTQGFDPDALAAIAESLDGLDRLSAERVGQEMTKLLSAPDPVQAVAGMHQIGVLHRLLPGADPRGLGPLVHLEDVPPDPMRRLAALGVFDGSGLRLSRAHQRRIGLYETLVEAPDGPAAMGYRHGFDIARDVLLLRSALLEAPFDPAALAIARKGADATFPVKAADLMPGLQGKALGDRLRLLEDRWIASGMTATKEELLA